MTALSGTLVRIVGSGFGGLSTACYLADAGADVTVLEKNDGLVALARRREVVLRDVERELVQSPTCKPAN